MAKTYAVKQFALYRQDGQEGICWNRDPGEEESQSWTIGTPLVEDDTSQEVEIHSDDGSVPILGIAVSKSTGTTGSDVPYYEANPYNIFIGTLRDDTAEVVLATTHINKAYGLKVTATANTYVDVSNTSPTCVQVLGPAPGYEIGDTNARVLIRFLSDEQQKLAAIDTV